TAASLFVALREGIIPLPYPGSWSRDRSRNTYKASAVLGNAMAERFKVRVTKDHLVFCSGHFISYEGDKCEKLHGHNYRATVEIEGRLDENHYVFDFIALKYRTKAITDSLDHYMMLPTRNPLIQVEET